VTDDGREIDFSESQPENAQSGISDNADPDSDVTEESEEHALKQ
jgi:hypothetical protein